MKVQATNLIKGALLLLSVVILYLYIPRYTPDDIKSFVSGFGSIAPIAFIGICIVKPILFFIPTMGLTVVAGALFGPIQGTIYVALGGAGSTVVGFYMTRWFGRKYVQRFIDKHCTPHAGYICRGFTNIDEQMGTKGFKTVLAMRFLSIPWDAVSYSAGLSKINFWDYYMASLIALGPTSFIYTYFGSTIFKPVSFEFALSVIMIILFGSIPYISRKIGSKKSVDVMNSHRNKL